METTEKIIHSKPPEGPGEVLIRGRKELGLEISNVAQMLHLSKKQIEGLEANDFPALPEPTYVRGYLRNYCQLLGIDPEPVLKTYNEAIGGWKTTTYSGLTAERQISSKDSIVRIGSFGIIGIVVILAVVWWLGEDEAPAPDYFASTRLGPDVSTAPESDSDSTETLFTQMEDESAPEELASVPPANAIVDDKEKSIEVASIPAQPVRPVVIPPKQESVTVNKQIPKVLPTTTVPKPGLSRLVLRTEATSWADIRDAHNNKLLYKLVPSGSVITLEGEAPLQVFLGNAEAVSLEFNGEDYDFSEYRRELTARFSLGEPASVEDEEP